MQSPSLSDIQKTLQTLLCPPEPTELQWTEAQTLVTDQKPVSVRDRLDIYRLGYLIRCTDAIKADYPRLYAALEEGNFQLLCRCYLETYPSRHPSLGELGKHLAEFLGRTSNGEQYPLLIDLARVEWLAMEAFWADDVKPTASLVGGEPETAALKAQPALRLMESAYPLLEIWTGDRQLSAKAVVESHQWVGEKKWFMVCREEGKVMLRRLENHEARFLEAIAGGQGLEAAGEAAYAAWNGAEEDFAPTIQARLAQWVAEKVLYL